MGKRKRSLDHTINKNDPPSSDNILQSSGAELLSKEKSSHIVDSGELKPFPSGAVASDKSMKLLHAHNSLSHPHYNVGHSVFLKRSRHHYSHQCYRRNSGNHGNASSSHGKGPPLRDKKLSSKLAAQCNTEPGILVESREKLFIRPERIRFSFLVRDGTPSDGVKMVCGICHKLLRRKPHFRGMGNTLGSGEYSVIAVLVCGHVYHADCLEQRTSLEDTCDPPCPLCLGLLSQVESSEAQ